MTTLMDTVDTTESRSLERSFEVESPRRIPSHRRWPARLLRRRGADVHGAHARRSARQGSVARHHEFTRSSGEGSDRCRRPIEDVEASERDNCFAPLGRRLAVRRGLPVRPARASLPAMDEMRSIDVAYYLGVSKQRVAQFASEQGFPQPRHLLDGTGLASGCCHALGRPELVGFEVVARAATRLRDLTSVYISGSPCGVSPGAPRRPPYSGVRTRSLVGGS